MAEEKKKVLIAVDGSDHADKALMFYLNRIHKTENQVILVYSPELSNVTLKISHGEAPSYEDWNRRFQDFQEQWAVVRKKYEAMLDPYKVTCEFIVEAAADTGAKIIEVSRRLGVNLIVSGSRGQGLLRRTMLGSVSDYIVHHSHVPVLIHH